MADVTSRLAANNREKNGKTKVRLDDWTALGKMLFWTEYRA
jgi:hypothetical protein